MMTDAELAELLRSVIARPDDLDVLRVYADVLIERGDLRGDMIAVQLQRREQDSPALVARERELAAALDVALAEQLGQPGAAFAWRRGFLEAVDFTPTREQKQLADTLYLLGTLAVARQLRRIVIRFVEPGWGAFAQLTSMLARIAPQLRGLRELVFTTSPRDDGIAAPHVPSHLGELVKLCRVIPKLEVLELVGLEYSTIRDAELPSLKRLVLEQPRRFGVQTLGHVQMPNVEELEIYDGAWSIYDLEGALARPWPLRSLVLQTTDLALMQALARVVPTSPLFERVRVFELRGVPLDRACTDELLLHTARLLKLQHLGIERTKEYRRLANVLGDIVAVR